MDGTSDGAIVYERDQRVGKGRFGPNSKIFLFKALNALGPLAWYYHQIILLSENRAPQVHMGVLKALMRHQATEFRLSRARRRRVADHTEGLHSFEGRA